MRNVRKASSIFRAHAFLNEIGDRTIICNYCVDGLYARVLSASVKRKLTIKRKKKSDPSLSEKRT